MANYIREEFHSDLDFGTGEWTASAWVNVPVTLPEASFPVLAPELNTSPGTWVVQAGTVNNGDGSYTATNSSASYLCYRTFYTIKNTLEVTFTISEYTSGSIRVLFAGSPGPYFSANGTYTVKLLKASYNNNPDHYLYFGNVGSNTTLKISNVSVKEVDSAVICERSYTSGAKIKISVTGLGEMVAAAYDGTTTRTVITPATYNTATWNKVRANYTKDGSLTLLVNGLEVARTVGTPLLTLNNSNAVLTIGNNYNLDAPFPGSLALVKFSGTVPTKEQSLWMYEQEKQLFNPNAKCLLPDSGAIVDLTYNDTTDSWIAASGTNISEWNGLIRNKVTPQANTTTTFTKVTAKSNVILANKDLGTSLDGYVDVTMPKYNIYKDFSNNKIISNNSFNEVQVLNYIGGFTGTLTVGTTSITSVTNLEYATDYIGAKISGTNIPANTYITYVSGTTIYISNPITQGAGSNNISFNDYILPVGYETISVAVDGVIKKETSDYTKLFDGFKETISFTTAPAYNLAVQLQIIKSKV